MNESNNRGGGDEKNVKSDSTNEKNHRSQETADEDSLLKLMSECNFASTSAEKFVEKLQNELLDLDTVRYIDLSTRIFQPEYFFKYVLI